MVKRLCKELHTLLDNLPKETGMEESLIRVGFVTYSNNIHFYNVKVCLLVPYHHFPLPFDACVVLLLTLGFNTNQKEYAKLLVCTLNVVKWTISLSYSFINRKPLMTMTLNESTNGINPYTTIYCVGVARHVMNCISFTGQPCTTPNDGCFWHKRCIRPSRWWFSSWCQKRQSYCR